jgi:hypothetical protein
MMAKQRPQPLQPYFPSANLANLKVFFSGRSAVVTIGAAGTIPDRQAVIIIILGPAFRALDFIRFHRLISPACCKGLKSEVYSLFGNRRCLFTDFKCFQAIMGIIN